MKSDSKYLIATAEIDGVIKEFYRDGKIEGFYTIKHYSPQDIKFLKSEIQNNNHIIKSKFNRVGYFFNDNFGFCKLYLPEVICELLKKDYNNDINAFGQRNKFVVYTEKINNNQARNRFYEHFSEN